MILNLIIIIISFSLIAFVNCFNETIPERFFNRYLDDENLASFWPPKTDNGEQPPFKYPFSFANTGRYNAGWTRQVSVRELPISTKMAGVQMYLDKGGIREMHWHACAEWAYMIYGHVRITAVDPNGLAFIDDVKEGDLWFFPAGVPHSIQGIGDHGGFFLLVFNDGNFNEYGTFLLSDWMRHIPRNILAENFQVDESTFDKLPDHDLYIFSGEYPRTMENERREVTEGTGSVPQTFAFFTDRMDANVTRIGGHVKIIDFNNFPVTNIAAAIVTLQPGGLRELHWHPNADEWQYYVTGKARMGVFNAGSEARTMDFKAGDVGYIPQTVPHYVENIGNEDLIFLEVFPCSYYQDISLAEWLAHTPAFLVNQHIKTGEAFIEGINKLEAVLEP